MTDKRRSSLNELQKRMGYAFSDISLLDVALTHSSYAKGDCKRTAHNERLEYLGDAVLELCVSELLYNIHKDWPEGALTRARASIVCEKSLYAIAKKSLCLQDYILLGHGEELTGGRDKPSIISDAMEAVIGALYLDGGLAMAHEFVMRIAKTEISDARGLIRDYKTSFQEYVQRRRLGVISYRLISEQGPEHKKTFIMQALLDEKVVGEGVGTSKQEASQHAARSALKKMKEE